MKNILVIFIIMFFLVINVFSQDVLIKNDIAIVNGNEYVKITKKGKQKFIIKDLKTDSKIVIVKTFKAYNTFKKESVFLPKVTFVELKKTWGVQTKSLLSKKDVITFLFNLKIIYPIGNVNSQMAINYYDYFKNLEKHRVKNE